MLKIFSAEIGCSAFIKKRERRVKEISQYGVRIYSEIIQNMASEKFQKLIAPQGSRDIRCD